MAGKTFRFLQILVISRRAILQQVQDERMGDFRMSGLDSTSKEKFPGPIRKPPSLLL